MENPSNRSRCHRPENSKQLLDCVAFDSSRPDIKFISVRKFAEGHEWLADRSGQKGSDNYSSEISDLRSRDMTTFWLMFIVDRWVLVEILMMMSN